YAGNLENLKAPLEQHRIQFHKLDIASAQDISGLFQAHRFDIVFHLAAETHVDRSIFKAVDFVRTNVLGTQLLLNAALGHPGTRFVHISTDEVYGSLGPTGRFVETTPLDPSSPYSASKAASDLMVQAAVKTHGLNALITRCTNNYGPYQFPEKLIPLFVTNALEGKKLPLYGDGMNVRSWLHVRDHCEALLLVAERGRAGEVYNIGGAEEAELPNVEITQRILKTLGKPESLIQYVADRPAHDRRYAIDYSKIHTELGWSPQVPVADGIDATVRWYVDNRHWWERIKSGEYLKFYELNYAARG
ncbi:MAG: dTDP-glucose 4,6-dehydratase, partial [Proteobacteria bacterium]|nr:dTDP-glucose 4,6-dehydratase [Pseudomonadota bacterium]